MVQNFVTFQHEDNTPRGGGFQETGPLARPVPVHVFL